MNESTDRRNRDHRAVHPAVLRVSGEDSQTRRWCAAVWSTNPEAPQLVDEIRSLVESTLAAYWMQPPAQYEPGEGAVNSFDLVFYDSVDDELTDRLVDDEFEAVDMVGMATDEYEQFEVFVEEADDHGISVAGRPDALWRSEVQTADAPGDGSWTQLGERVAEMLQDNVWGDTPGWFSRAFCEELGSVSDIDIQPDRQGLARLEEVVAGEETDGIRWLDPVAFQALCDFVGVVVQAETSMEVQWGTSPVDEETGLAPLALMRMREGRQWTRIPVGRDVLQRLALPWCRNRPGAAPGEVCTTLIEEYQHRTRGS